jgi:hypothetical protein
VISYRHHITSLVAVFLALAVGIVLGGGPLSELGRDDKPVSATARDGRAAARAAGYGDRFAAAGAQALYAGGLRGHAVAVLRMPGAPGDDISALGTQVEAAGGSVAGTYDLRPALLDAGSKALVDTLGSQLMTQLDDGLVADDAPTYVRMGQLLGLAVTGSKLSAADLTSVRESLAGADLLGYDERVDPAATVLVVTGRTTNPAVLTGLMTGLADRAAGVVVAGDAAAATPSGDLGALRAEPDAGQVATVDGVETTLGQVTAVLALIRSLTVQGGEFGASGSDGAVPLT